MMLVKLFNISLGVALYFYIGMVLGVSAQQVNVTPATGSAQSGAAATIRFDCGCGRIVTTSSPGMVGYVIDKCESAQCGNSMENCKVQENWPPVSSGGSSGGWFCINCATGVRTPYYC